MKYTLETHGWTVDASCHSLTDEQVSKIQEIMTENGYDELWEMRNEIEENLDINIFEPNMFQVSKGIHNNSLYFYVKDEEGNIVTKFGVDETSDVYNVIPNIEDYKYEGYDAYPSNDNKNILFIVDEFKGGISDYVFESGEVPTPEDFSYQIGGIETPDGEWEFISKVFFKTTELEVYDNLDNTNKSSKIDLWKLEDDEG
jgi:hypothetical protein